MKKIILLTNYRKIIPQRKIETEGLNLNIISKVLEDNSFEIEEMSINSFISCLNNNESIAGVYFYYTSSQYPIYKSFILDILMQITLRGGILIPDLSHFMAHENKNFQELEKVRLDIQSPIGIPVGSYEGGVEILNNTSYPKVIKKATGFGSRNVKLAHNKKEGKKILFKMLENNFKFDIDSLYYLYRRTMNKIHYPKRFGKVIIQEFIPNLAHDWKIIVLGNRYMGGKRFVRKNDFRASGSNLYSLNQDPTKEVLDFAMGCKQKLNCPIVSMDISEHKGDLQLLEYQSMHFSLLANRLAHFFELENGSWEKRRITDELEHYIGMGICQFICQPSK